MSVWVGEASERASEECEGGSRGSLAVLGRTLLQLVITATTTSYYLVTVVRSITNFAWCNFSLVVWRKSSKQRQRRDNQGKKKRRNSLLPSPFPPLPCPAPPWLRFKV